MGEISLVTALAPLLHAQPGSPFILSCCFTSWAQCSPPPAVFVPSDIDPCLCTHLLYAFATIKNNQLATYEWNDVELYSQFKALKNNNGNMKTLLSVRGWDLSSQGFSQMVMSSANRRTFIKSVISFLRNHEFDGLNIKWQYSANRGRSSKDKHYFSIFLKEMRAAFEKEAKQSSKARLLMSAAVSAGMDTIDSAYQIPQLGRKPSCAPPANHVPRIAVVSMTHGRRGPSVVSTPGLYSGMEDKFCTGKADGFYPNPENRNMFYECIQGKTFFQSCAPGLVFDSFCLCCSWA